MVAQVENPHHSQDRASQLQHEQGAKEPDVVVLGTTQWGYCRDVLAGAY